MPADIDRAEARFFLSLCSITALAVETAFPFTSHAKSDGRSEGSPDISRIEEPTVNSAAVASDLQSSRSKIVPDDRVPIFPTPWPHRGPTLRSEPKDILGETPPLCAECPSAWWYKIDGRFECYCTTFHGVMFGRTNPAVTACDAREEAIKSLPPGSTPK